jgi:hypothetical protein
VTRGGLVLAVLGTVAAVTAVLAAMRVDAPITSDYGLVAVMPPTFWAGVLVLNLLLGLALSIRVPSSALASLLLGLLVLVVYGAPGLATGTPRLEVTWRHLGITREIMRSGTIDPSIDAYFSWPGFFAGLGSLVTTTGISPEVLALGAPVANALFWLLGVAIVVRTLTTDRRHLWLSLWLFTLINWIDQDYLSPQAFGFFLHLVVVALLLSSLAAVPGVAWRSATSEVGLRQGTTSWWRSRRPTEPNARRRVAALCLVVFLSTVIVATHQLTPLMLFAVVVGLTFTGRLWSPGLPIVLGIVIALWLTTAASSYLSGHPVLFQSEVAETASATLLERIDGTAGHVWVVGVRIALTATAALLAVLGWWSLRRQGRRDLRPLVLMGVPFVLVPLQSYGGEMLMRATLFSFPFVAYHAAALFLTGRQPQFLRAVAAPILLTSLLAVAVFTGRYGNAAFDMFTDAELRGTRQLYELSPPGALLFASAHPTPWKFRDYASHRHATLTEACEPPMSMRKCYWVVRNRASSSQAGAMILLTRGGQESVRIQGDAGPRGFAPFEDMLRRQGEARLVYRNVDVRIYRLVPQTGGRQQ